MLIDDDPDHHQIIGNILKRKGYSVLSLIGCESLNQLTRSVLIYQPDLIFMDHHMPNICGTDATQALRSNPITKPIRVIYFSASDDIERLAKQAGADSFLRKPFQQKEMQRLLELYS